MLTLRSIKIICKNRVCIHWNYKIGTLIACRGTFYPRAYIQKCRGTSTKKKKWLGTIQPKSWSLYPRITLTSTGMQTAQRFPTMGRRCFCPMIGHLVVFAWHRFFASNEYIILYEFGR